MNYKACVVDINNKPRTIPENHDQDTKVMINESVSNDENRSHEDGAKTSSKK
ncbi:14118_t:CDS:2 [Entrophospora sp. SA101]|nr:857_t:CDS:2 [Entrophospora sp. SA101]CAJ0830597.1 2708_t:CDS:2 [Entrophospora sp. SA101]CAJ0830996.1 9154_t:CDS:2 [Entrophospora sp. SA101]CAJ0908048.1 14118_t:CDS:2 [Entrophospora sp. SA101]